MKRSLLFALWCAGHAGFAQAEIYKYVDADGHVTYSSTPRKGAKKLNLDPLPVAPPPARNRSESRSQPSPADFPKVDGATQKNRDNARRKILEDEMAAEEKLLSEARRSLSSEQARNPSPANEKIRTLREELALHEKNIAALRAELGNIK